MLLFRSIVAASLVIPHSMACILEAPSECGSNRNIFSCPGSTWWVPFKKRRTIRNVLVVSWFLLRAKHSSDYCGVVDGMNYAESTSDDRLMSRGEVGATANMLKEEKLFKSRTGYHLFGDSDDAALW
ncbi:hypothetical protein Nepgr_011546 [Nepenthes gracilis]|uniref:Secreted protein n=1 Tax=Nepenthes gracilis TaxID=150966 RepID=A0AAD3XMF0_NEPGR|nr:hypothetical protein Nepgr_011546 [Nepenthes gracilis]